MEFWIWIAIMIVVAIVKSLGQLKGADDDEEPTAPARRVRPRERRRAPQRQSRPSTRDTSRQQPPPVMAPPPPAHRKRQWQVPLDDLQDFLGRLESAGQPSFPPPATPPPLVETVSAPTRPQKPKSALSTPVQKVEAPTTSRKRNRGMQWAEALRDRENVRNIVLAAEIIGPPKSLNR